MKDQVLRLGFHGEPAHLTIVRAFVGSVLRTLEQPEQMIADLRLAISELAAVLVNSDAGEADLEFIVDDGEFRLAVSGPDPMPSIPEETVALVKALTGDRLLSPSGRWIVGPFR